MLKYWILVVSVVCGLCVGCQSSQVRQNSTSDGKATVRRGNDDGGNSSLERNVTKDDVARLPERSVSEDLSPRENPVVQEAPPSGNAGVWSAFQVIDVHAHIGTFRGYDLSAPTLMKNIQKFGVVLALISNIDGANLIGTTLNLDEQKANQATVDTVKAYPKQLRGIAWTRPNDGSLKKIEPFLKMKLTTGTKGRIFVAMKFHPEMNQFAADSSKIDGYMKLCEKYKLVAVFHNGGPGSNSSPERIYKAAQRFPKVPVVLYHMGFGGQHQASIDVVKQAIQKKNALLYLGTAQADPKAVVKAVKELGSPYVMFGTDATYFGMNHYDRYKPMVELLQKELSAADFANVMRRNAKRVFAL